MLRAALVTPLSGPLAGYGRAGALALHLWSQWRGDTELTVVDSHPGAADAVARAETMSPDVLFGPYGSGPARAVTAATSRLVFNHGGARLRAGHRVVPVLAPAETYFAGAVRLACHAGGAVRAVAIAHSPTGFGRAVARGAETEARRLGLSAATTVLPQHPPDADVLLVAGGFSDELAAARQLLPGPWSLAGFVGAGVEEVLAELGPDREGLIGPAQWLPEAAPSPTDGPTAAGFVTAYRRATGDEPPYPAAQAFAAGVIADRCVRDAGTTDDDAVLAAARSLDCTTMFAPFRLDPRTGEQAGHRVLTVQCQDGERRVVWPPDRAQAPLRFPATDG
ncbi:ABC transporter substrate-binding protein [Prauserella cavernicola]|uniref:ABC transporter substrate-binding protein n=1 Tax=Prauserella cavernicola TaxID=2800127 RepID=A0A934QNU8_9PSEU|nr:ABC transporter substrate-binding protein [Prauserella cavernicola]MBK1782783.1 ABC transporter substrate-binding protein [Prauserella cavernicola]